MCRKPKQKNLAIKYLQQNEYSNYLKPQKVKPKTKMV